MNAETSPLMRGALDDATRRLAGKFRGVFSGESVGRCVEGCYAQIGDRPTIGPNLVPLFVEKFARVRLQAVARVEGIVAKEQPEVLFVCEHHAGRSQMASALTHRLPNGAVAVRFAGTRPGEMINPVALTGDRKPIRWVEFAAPVR